MKKVNLTTTFAQLKAAGACEEGYKKLAKSLGGIKKYGNKTPISLIQILNSNGVDDCLWSLRVVEHPERDKIARFIACDCAEAVLYIYEKYNQTDKRPHEAIKASRSYAEGLVSIDELNAAWSAVSDDARNAARNAAWSAASDAASDAARNDASDAARNDAWSAAWNAAWSAVSDIIRQYLTDSEEV